MLRNVLKLIVSLAWVIVLPICYVQSSDYSPVDVKEILSFLPKQSGIPPLYMLAVALYLLPNLLAACLFIFPMLRRWIENSDWHIIRLLLWWSQVRMIPAFVVYSLPPLTISYHAKYFGSMLQSVNCSGTNLKKSKCTRQKLIFISHVSFSSGFYSVKIEKVKGKMKRSTLCIMRK